jgi:hypothetical protein
MLVLKIMSGTSGQDCKIIQVLDDEILDFYTVRDHAKHSPGSRLAYIYAPNAKPYRPVQEYLLTGVTTVQDVHGNIVAKQSPLV